MRKSAIMTLLLLCAAFTCRAGRPAASPILKFGIEWGMTESMFEAVHINYVSFEGYRVNESRAGWTANLNGYVCANFGACLAESLCVSLNAGFAGLADGSNMVPLTLRCSYFPKGIYSDGTFLFLDGGCGFRSPQVINPCILGTGGAGYRFVLNGNISLDFLLGLYYSRNHPDLIDQDTGEKIKESSIRTNNAENCSLKLSVALNF